jgi:hypothetical protein
MAVPIPAPPTGLAVDVAAHGVLGPAASRHAIAGDLRG